MSDYTVVYFTAIERGFSVPSVLADFNLFGLDITIRWYGAIIAFGFLLAVLFGGRIAYTWKMSLDKMIDVLIYGTFAGIIGARLFYVFSKWSYYGHHLSEIPQIWNGGLAIYGGLIGGLIAAYVVCKVRKMNFFNLLDVATMSFLLAQGIGRWGNYTNQEAFGTNTDLPWGMWSKKVAEHITANADNFAAQGISVDASQPVHPTFLYESLWCLLGFVVLYIICKKFRKFSGQIALCYGVWYGAERMIVEGMRTDSLYIADTGIRVSQLISGLLIAVCAVLLIILLRKYKKNPKPIDGVDYFLEEQLKAQKQEPAAPAVKQETQETAEEIQPAQEEKMSKVINGKEISAKTLEDIAARVAAAKESGTECCLAVIIVGDNPASRVYVNNKKKACENAGIKSLEFALPEETTTAQLLELIAKLNSDESVNGILCQLPLPAQIDKNAVLDAILPEKDVDCFHPVNVGKLSLGKAVLLPCTPAGIMKMLDDESIPVAGKNCVVIGRSDIVGKPMAMQLLAKDATVTVCHSKTEDLASITRQADVLIAAVGRAKFVTADMVKDGAVVIDVGMNRDENGKLCGDVDYAAVESKASAITPVPGGVGPMTITMLMQNTLTAALEQNK